MGRILAVVVTLTHFKGDSQPNGEYEGQSADHALSEIDNTLHFDVTVCKREMHTECDINDRSPFEINNWTKNAQPCNGIEDPTQFDFRPVSLPRGRARKVKTRKRWSGKKCGKGQGEIFFFQPVDRRSLSTSTDVDTVNL